MKFRLGLYLLLLLDLVPIFAVSRYHLELGHRHLLQISSVFYAYSIAALLWVAFLYIFDTYNPHNNKHPYLALKLIAVSTIFFSGMPSLFRIFDLSFSLKAILMTGAVTPLFLILIRLVVHHLIYKRVNSYRIFLIGSTEENQKAHHFFKDLEYCSVVSEACLEPDNKIIEQLQFSFSEHRVNAVCIGNQSQLSQPLMHELIAKRLNGSTVQTLGGYCQNLQSYVDLDTVSNEWILYSSMRFRGFSMDLKLKRLLDIFMSFLGMIVCSPLLLILFFLNPLFNPGSLFYKQLRVGYRGKTFKIYKFRSMISTETNVHPQWASKNDTRVTPLGKLLRRSHLDELPQLLNIFKGEMSLVGPRPEQFGFIQEIEKKIPFYNVRHYVKPGLTGWAQTQLLYVDSVELTRKKLEYDLYYLSRFSFAFDLYIIVQTVKNVIFAKGR